MVTASKKSAEALLTDTLLSLAKEKTEVVENSTKRQTKAQALAGLIWKKALGYNEKSTADGKTKYYPPATWAIQIIYDRLEGKAGPPEEKAGKRPKVTKRISDLAKSRANKIAESNVTE